MGTPKGWKWPLAMREKMEARHGTPRERFNRNYEPDPNSGCWLWTGTIIKGTGYGQIQVGKRAIGAHRFSWMLHCDEIPPGMSVLHKCDVRCCVNPAHLWIGTASDNMRDMIEKGRGRAPFGEQAGSAKLRAADIPPIMDRLANGEACAAIAADYGLTDCAITAIREGVSWNSVTGLPKRRQSRILAQ